MNSLPLGLTYRDIGKLVTIVFMPLVLSCYYVTTGLVCLSLLYVAFFLYRKSTTKRITINGQGVLITGCDTGKLLLSLHMLLYPRHRKSLINWSNYRDEHYLRLWYAYDVLHIAIKRYIFNILFFFFFIVCLFVCLFDEV